MKFPVFGAVLFSMSAALSGCGRMDVMPLPDASLLGNPRGLRLARVITHSHSPYSYDACDKNGLPGGVPNASCLGDLKAALCTNKIDYLFLTDHPDAMQNYEMDTLLLPQGADQLVTGPHGSHANRVSGCEGFTPTIMVGFENKLMALAMDKHLDSDIAARSALYIEETVSLRNRLKNEADAIVLIPHTESRSVSLIQSLNPDGIEIYNVHANLDPKIRKKDLGLAPVEHLPRILTYLIDPYRDLRADYMFLQFLSVSPLYFQTWNSLISGGMKVAGYGGSDSHENIFPQTASDGERLDSHRRLTRFMSNHLVVPDLSVSNVKTALREGRSWLVFEGFGSPVGMDFSASVGGTTVGVGQTLSLGGGTATIRVKAPGLYPDSHYGSESPSYSIVLKKIGPGSSETTVASSAGTDLNYETNTAGIFRAEVSIIPRHLRPLLGTFQNLANQSYLWVITNHVYVEL